MSCLSTFIIGTIFWRAGIVGELHGDQLRQAKALDKHCQSCAEEINRRGFDILFANSSIIQAVSSIGRYVKAKKVLYLQEPNRWLLRSRRKWIAMGCNSRGDSAVDAPQLHALVCFRSLRYPTTAHLS